MGPSGTRVRGFPERGQSPGVSLTGAWRRVSERAWTPTVRIGVVEGLHGWLRARLRVPAGAEDPLLAASRREYLSQRDRFAPTHHVYGRVHGHGRGLYVLVAPHLGPGDPVVAVGWARNDYWAVRVWGFDGEHFRNDFDADAHGADEPSLVADGWPHPLGYAETIARAKRLGRHRVVTTAGYRLTDGAFTSHGVWAAPRVKFHYEHPAPDPEDTPVAIELGLVGPRWEEHLAEVRAINRENGFSSSSGPG